MVNNLVKRNGNKIIIYECKSFQKGALNGF
jgi:hypothetical protein